MFFRDIVSGRRRGLVASAIRLLLRGAETPYRWEVQRRNRRFDRIPSSMTHVNVPVVSVGNLTLGGTGKTPFVAWLAQWFREQGNRPVIVSRGYGSGSENVNDEALELAQRLPNVPHVQNPDRVLAAQSAIEQHGCDVIILDDGFQHRRLGRDVDLVLIDALEPFGFEHVFPRGTLREPLENLKRADVVALSRSMAVDDSVREEIRSRARQLAPDAVWIEIDQKPTQLINSSTTNQPIGSLTNMPVAAFCGIGNPEAFRSTLRRCGYELVDFRAFPDHHLYSPSDLESLTAWAKQAQADAIVCTQKDLVKLPHDRLGDIPVWALQIETELLQGHKELVQQLRPLVVRLA